MKYLILAIALFLPLSVNAIECIVPDNTYAETISWTDPTLREADDSGVEKPFAHKEIKSYQIRWYDITDTNMSCMVTLNTHAIDSYTLNLEAGITYGLRMRVSDLEGRSSRESVEVQITTAGVPVDPTSPPKAPEARIVITY